MERYRTIQFHGSSRYDELDASVSVVIVNENCFWFDQNSNVVSPRFPSGVRYQWARIARKYTRARARTILIDAYRGGFISLLAPYDSDNYDRVQPTDISHRIGLVRDGIVDDGNFDSQLFLLITLIFFLFRVSFFCFLFLFFSILRFDFRPASTFFTPFHGIIIIHNFCSVNGNDTNQFKKKNKNCYRVHEMQHFLRQLTLFQYLGRFERSGISTF